MIFIRYRLFLLIGLLISLLSLNVSAQLFKHQSVSYGMTVSRIMGDNRANLSILPPPNAKEAIIGGSMGVYHPGMELRFTGSLDEEDNYRIPISLEYDFFYGREFISEGPNIVNYFLHDVDIFTFNTGFHYVFAEIKEAGAKIYAGAELKFNYLSNVKFEHEIDYLMLDEMDTIRTYSKGTAFRFGTQLKIGIDGQIRKNFYINTGFNLGIMNLLGKNDSRGELFTPTKLNESQESNVFFYQVFILLQLKLN